MAVPNVELSRVNLREMTQDDLDFVHSMLANAEVMKHYPKCYSRDEAREWIERNLQRYEDDGAGFWIVQDAEGTPVGQIGLLMQDVDELREPEVAYMISQPYWRKGYANEVATAIRDWAMDERGHSHVISLIRPSNLPSQGVARSIGMKPWKTTRHRGLEHLVFRIRRTDRDALRAEQGGATTV